MKINKKEFSIFISLTSPHKRTFRILDDKNILKEYGKPMFEIQEGGFKLRITKFEMDKVCEWWQNLKQ